MKKLSKKFLTIAIAVCLGNALFSIISLLLSALIVSGETSTSSTTIFSSIVSLAINVLFYVMIAFEFKKAKDGNKSYATTAVLTLALCDFIIPLFTSFLVNLIYDGLMNAILEMVFLLLTTAFGVVYSIFLILDLRHHKNSYVLVMKVFGVFLLLIGIASFVVTTTSMISSIQTLLGSQIETRTFTLYLITYIVEIVLAFINLGFNFIYFYFPFYLSYIRN